MDALTEHYAQLLGLREGWKVTEVDLDLPAQKVTIRLRRAPGSVCVCPGCGETRPLKDHAEERRWRRLDTTQFETVLVARTPRTNCPACGVLNVDLPWADPHGRFTLMFQAFAIRVLQASASIEQGRNLLGLSWHAAQNLMSVIVERGHLVRDTEGVTEVGMDEKSFSQGQDYVSVLADIKGIRVLDVAPGRTRESADRLWNTLSNEQKQEVQAVALDMWPAFLASEKDHVPNAKIVHDRFHISKHLGEAVDQVRRAEHKALKVESDERLTGSRYLWLTNEQNQSEKQAASFEDLKNAKLKTARAWTIRELFREFWDQPGQFTARAFFEDWSNWVSRSRLKPMIKVGRILKRHLDHLVTWFEHPITNAAAEGFNSKIQALKSAARGFGNFKKYRTRILVFCGRLPLESEIL